MIARRDLLGVVVVALATTACAPRLVHDVHIEGYDLVVERCNSTSMFAACSTTREPLPVGVNDAAPLPRSPDRVARFALVTAAAGELASCATRAGVREPVHLALALDDAGAVVDAIATPAPADADFEACAIGVFADARFPRSTGARVAFVLPGGGAP